MLIAGTTQTDQSTSAGIDSSDVWLAKLDSDRQLVWKTVFGGSSYDTVAHLAIDPEGNVLLCGKTQSEDLSAALNAFPGGYGNGYLARVSADGELQWTKYFGGVPAVTVDDEGLAVVAGYPAGPGNSSAYVMKLDSTGSIVSQQSIGAGTTDIILDHAGNTFVAGFQIVRAFGPSGEQLWFKRYEDAYLPRALALAIDSSGNLLVLGGQYSWAWEDSHGAHDAFLEKYTPSGELLWKTQMDFGGGDDAQDIAIDSDGNALIVGYTWRDSSPGWAGPGQEPDRSSGFIAKIAGDGTLLWSSKVDRYLFALDLDSSGNAFIAGRNLKRVAPFDAYIAELPRVGDEYLVSNVTVKANYSLAGSDIRITSTTIVHDGAELPAIQVSVNGDIRGPFIADGPLTIIGTYGDDSITVDPAITTPIIVYGKEGNDTIIGGSGDDSLFGDAGNDLLVGGNGNDTLSGFFGADTLNGSAGNDSLDGQWGRDLLNGHVGDDSLIGGNGMDHIYGGPGADHIEGRGKADTLHGGMGNDTILSGAGADVILGEDGDDDLYANAQPAFRDTLRGGTGHDRYKSDEDDLLSDVEEPLLG